jgi:hypothetical protein
MIQTIGIVIAVLIAAVLGVAATKPDTFRVQREATIAARPERIYPFLEDFRRWNAWSPYEKKDPELKRAFSGAPSGKGAVYAWEGNREVGTGRMEILDSAAPSRVTIKLDFLKPFEAHNTAEFTLAPAGGDSTRVTWAIHGPSPYPSKLIGLFCNVDQMVGRDFEAGLANLKAIAER